MSGEGIESVDEKLTAAFEKREQAQDDLIRALTAIDTADDAHWRADRQKARREEEGGDMKTVFAAIGLLLACRRGGHVWDFEHCVPEACARCGRTATARPRWRLGE